MTWGLVVAGVGAVAGGLIASSGAKSAANTAAQGADAAAAEQGREFDITQVNAAPAITAGQGAISRLNSIYSGSGPDYSSFFTSPDYNFTKQQGMEGIENSFSASGGAKSGNALKALADFNSNLAAGQFGNYFNRQAAIAGIGQTATGQVGAAGSAAGAQIGNSLIQGADARASGVAGSTNALTTGIGGAAQGLGYYLQNRGNYGNGYQVSGGFGQNPSGDPAAGQYVDWSDRRLKENIREIGKTDAGLPIYRYTMKGTGEGKVGVMADEAKKKFPNAVKRDASGYSKVNYLRIH